MNHISFPSIGQFKQVVKTMRDAAKYHETTLPTVKFRGTVKLHGTNAAVCRTSTGEVYSQSRERTLDLLQDNAGFCAFTQQHQAQFNVIFDRVAAIKSPAPDEVLQVYGEWCGGNIQKGVGISKHSKMFVVFGIRVSSDASSNTWFTKDEVQQVMQGLTTDAIKSIFDFQSWEVDIPFANPESVQNKLVDITIQVETQCPVAKALLPDCQDDLIGEGVVWTAVESSNPLIKVDGLMFKVKGEKHSVSKVKTLAEVDEVKLASVAEFVDMVVTTNRLSQGVDVLKQRGIECNAQNTGEFIRWVMSDCLKEESGAMVNSGLCTKDITGPICNRARQYWLNLD